MSNSISRVFELFETISQIPHCSFKADKLKSFIYSFAKERGYSVEVDSAGNILAKKPKPKLCLQAHYDMVCVGRAPDIEIVEDSGYLKAIESSLGADNGIGVAMMLALIEEGCELEFLFSSDEEVGLIGAKALEFELESDKLINLDNEEEGVVLIGCAGGVDLIANQELNLVESNYPFSYEVEVSNLPGGHSGVDIDKDIPNAIKVLAQFLADKKIELISFSGGERRNSIPVSAKATIRANEKLNSKDLIKVKEIKLSDNRVLKSSSDLIRLLATAPSGVVEFNNELNLPQSSLNLAIVVINKAKAKIDYSLRAMSEESLDNLVASTKTLLKRYGFEISESERYPSWEPKVDSFKEYIRDILKEEFGNSKLEAIHAGLECGVLSKKYPDIKMASIGPNIKNPHSIRERVEINSVIKSFKALKRIIKSL